MSSSDTRSGASLGTSVAAMSLGSDGNVISNQTVPQASHLLAPDAASDQMADGAAAFDVAKKTRLREVRDRRFI